MKGTTQKSRAIDRLRDGAGSITLQTPGDNTDIRDMLIAGERLLLIKDKGVYEVKLADQIDPNRTNIATPNTMQRILPYGANEAWIGATLLTPYSLLVRSKIQNNVDGDKAFALVLAIVEDISGAQQLRQSYDGTETDAMAGLDRKIRPDRSILVPAIGDVEATCNEFLLRSDHALRKLFRLVRIFYPDIRSGGWESLKTKIDAEPGTTDDFPKFLAETLPFLQLIRNARNCVEHPRPEQRLVVTDFTIDARNTLLPPTIQVIDPRTPIEKTLVRTFFEQSLQKIVGIVELLIVFMCARNVSSLGGSPICIAEIPPERRRSPHVRYGYAALIGDKLIPFS